MAVQHTLILSLQSLIVIYAHNKLQIEQVRDGERRSILLFPKMTQPALKITENHASVTNNVGIFKTPKRYARKNNDLILSMNREIAESENEVLLIDFVNLK